MRCECFHLKWGCFCFHSNNQFSIIHHVVCSASFPRTSACSRIQSKILSCILLCVSRQDWQNENYWTFAPGILQVLDDMGEANRSVEMERERRRQKAGHEK